MRISQAYKTIELAHSIDAATMMWGGPGLGKSSLAHQYAADKKLAIIDWRLTLMDSVDMRGTPFRDKDGYTVWAPPGELPRESTKGILLLDELPQARMEVKNVAAMLVLEKRIGEWKLPKGWWILAAGNRMGDAAGTSPMPTHLNNRFWHIDVDFSIEDLLKYATEHDWDYRVIAFLKFKPEAAFAFDPKSKDAAFATPRTWEKVSQIVKRLGTEHDILALDPAILSEMIAGNVGRGYGGEFVGFMRVMHELVTMSEILSNPDTAKVSTEPSVCYAVVTGLTRAVEKSNVANAFKYVLRMGKDLAFVFAKKLETEQPKLRQTKAFVEFCAANADYL